ncbi:tRNA-dependent cyclodipeptide synthase [Streptomyces odontomachi]|uniref:tRNA-dependent cyclodipeptide synthase n=1 Tax=Streptomyces odontomachi TaxID=2944940 RepID=UPI00210B9191|nr:tRNA-dependent cyclodipeptide synthase [Streptomyces sp. ODS25]
MFAVEPLTDNCRRILDQGEHVLIGVSPRNSYFTEARITELLRWSAKSFRLIDVVIPDFAEVETWLALGYPDTKAHRKTRSKAAHIRNRVIRAGDAAAVPASRLRVLLLSDLAARPDYQSALRRCEETVAQDAVLREMCLRPARHALRCHLNGSEPTPAQVDRAMRYIIAEMPLMLDVPGMLDVDHSTLIYHQRLEFIDWIFFGNTSLRMSERQAYVVVRPTETGEAQGRK